MPVFLINFGLNIIFLKQICHFEDWKLIEIHIQGDLEHTKYVMTEIICK